LAAKQAKYERIMRANEVARKQADRDAKVRAKAAKQRAYDESSDDEDDLSDDDDYGKNSKYQKKAKMERERVHRVYGM